MNYIFRDLSYLRFISLYCAYSILLNAKAMNSMTSSFVLSNKETSFILQLFYLVDIFESECPIRIEAKQTASIGR